MTATSDQPNPETLAYEQQSYEQQIQTKYIEQQISPVEVIVKSEPQDDDNDNDSDDNDEFDDISISNSQLEKAENDKVELVDLTDSDIEIEEDNDQPPSGSQQLSESQSLALINTESQAAVKDLLKVNKPRGQLDAPSASL